MNIKTEWSKGLNCYLLTASDGLNTYQRYVNEPFEEMNNSVKEFYMSDIEHYFSELEKGIKRPGTVEVAL